MRRNDWKRYGVGLTIAVLWAWGAANVGKGDYEGALVQDAIRKDPPPIPYTLPLTFPLGCDITIEQNGQRPKCYFFKGKHGR